MGLAEKWGFSDFHTVGAASRTGGQIEPARE